MLRCRAGKIVDGSGSISVSIIEAIRCSFYEMDMELKLNALLFLNFHSSATLN